MNNKNAKTRNETILISSIMSFSNARLLRLTDADTEEAFEVYVLPKMEPAALVQAVSARLGHTNGFFLTTTSNRQGAVVPLSAELPDGCSLVVHKATQPRAASNGASDSFQQRQERLPSSGSGSKPEATNSMTQPLLLQPCGCINEAATSSSRPMGFDAPGHLDSGVEAMPADAMAAAASTPPGRRAHPQGSIGSSVSNQLQGLERLSRLTTDLANERTLLAWTRTCLASIRTLFAFLEVRSADAGWQVWKLITEMSMATVVLACAGLGAWRYFAIKRILSQKVPPQHFGRISIRPLCALLVLVAVATSTAIYAQKWQHQSGGAHPPSGGAEAEAEE
jgi:uncharacterized membrane protein YidH (DUF202 family)